MGQHLRLAHVYATLAAVAAVLALGANSLEQSYAAASPEFARTADLTIQRAFHTATTLGDGRVLIAGGNSDGSTTLRQAELYDPATGTFAPTGTASVPNAKATLLKDGRVLFTFFQEAEIYNPVTGQFSSAGQLFHHQGRTTTVLPDGTVFMAGGFGRSDGPAGATGPTSFTQIYDPSTGTSREGPRMIVPRAGHSATLLPTGKVLLAGGGYGPTGSEQTSAELFDPAAGTFTMTGSLASDRPAHQAVLLPTGNVLIVGGVSPRMSAAELYETATGLFVPTGSMSSARAEFTATSLANGDVLILGGLDDGGSTDTAERYNWRRGVFEHAGTMGIDRLGHAAALLRDSRVLIAGGLSGIAAGTGSSTTGGTVPPRPEPVWERSAEIYTPPLDRVPPTVICTATPSVIWPPDQRMVPVTATVDVQDEDSGPAGFTLAVVASSDPGSDDVEGFVIGAADLDGLVRAERESAAGRNYTLTYRGFDNAGNAADCSTTIHVPHDQR